MPSLSQIKSLTISSISNTLFDGKEVTLTYQTRTFFVVEAKLFPLSKEYDCRKT